MTEILALILARGGSKGVPHKNIRLLCGKPLIAYSIEHAFEVQSINRIIVSTDDSEIAKISLKYGAEVPFSRPKILAQDDTPIWSVIQHTLNWLKENENYSPDFLVLLQPPCPIREIKITEEVIETLHKTGCTSVRTVYDIGKVHPYYMLCLKGNKAFPYIPDEPFWKYPNRQLLPPLYRHNGVVDAFRYDVLMSSKYSIGDNMYGDDVRVILMEEGTWVNIDTEFDFKIAELMFKHKTYV